VLFVPVFIDFRFEQKAKNQLLVNFSTYLPNLSNLVILLNILVLIILDQV